MRARLSLVGVFAASVASLVALTVAPVASAAVVQPAPIGDTTVDPIVQLGIGIGSPGGYTPAEIQQIVERVGGYDQSAGGQPARDYLCQWLGTADCALMETEGDDASTSAGTLPTLTPSVPFSSSTGNFDPTGKDQFQQSITTSTGAHRTRYVVYDHEQLGGTLLEVPSGPGYAQGTDWRPMSDMGWVHVSDYDSLHGGNQPGWVFNFKFQIYGNTTGTTYAWDSGLPPKELEPGTPGSTLGTDDYGRTINGGEVAPAPAYCDTASWNYCVGTSSATWAASYRDQIRAWYHAIANSITDLDGAPTPLVATGDLKVNQTGHPLQGITCNRASAASDCGMVYIPDTNGGLPHRTSASPVAGARSHSAPAFTQPAPDNATRTTINTYVTNHSCAISWYRALVQPGKYTYSGCTLTVTRDGTTGTNSSSEGVAPAAPPATTAATFHSFVLPQPETGESYQDYLDRLRALGWVGSAAVTAETNDVPGAGPLGITRVQVGAGTVVELWTPLPWDGVSAEPTAVAWPDNPPLVETADEGITLRVNSAAAPPLPGRGGLDFTPITGVDFGCKFPYGFICYAQQVTAWFDVAPSAPVFDMKIGNPDLNGGGFLAQHYRVDLSVMDDWMATWRTILSVVIWVGAVYVLATRLLGLQLGDPGEAIDDAME